MIHVTQQLNTVNLVAILFTYLFLFFLFVAKCLSKIGLTLQEPTHFKAVAILDSYLEIVMRVDSDSAPGLGSLLAFYGQNHTACKKMKGDKSFSTLLLIYNQYKHVKITIKYVVFFKLLQARKKICLASWTLILSSPAIAIEAISGELQLHSVQ